MKKAVIVLVVVAVVLFALIGAVLKSAAAAAAKKAESAKAGQATVARNDVVVKVVETGTIDAAKAVEVKSRAGGQLKQLLVDEGDSVVAGRLIAVIDPQQTQIQVAQGRAQLAGARSGVDKALLEIEQRRITAQADLSSARQKVAQLEEQYKIQPRLTNADIQQAQTALNTARQEKDRLVRTLHPNQRVTSQDALREAQANYDNAISDYNRQIELESKGYVSKRDVENGKLAVDVARARVSSAKDNLDRLDSGQRIEIQKADEAISQARAGLDRAKANSIQNDMKRQDYLTALSEARKAEAALRDIPIMAKGREQQIATVQQLGSALSDSERLLRETQVTAPISGIVSKRYVQAGELVTSLSSFSSGTPIVRIEDHSTMLVKLNVNEIDMAKMAVGMQATVTVDALPGKSFAGTISKIAPASTAAAASVSSGSAAPGSDTVVKYPVEIRLAGTGSALKSGMSAKVTVEVTHKNHTLTLPAEYVGRDKDGVRFVSVAAAKPGDKPVRHNVVTGAESVALIEILSGVREGDIVVKPDFSGPERKGAMQFGGGGD